MRHGQRAGRGRRALACGVALAAIAAATAALAPAGVARASGSAVEVGVDRPAAPAAVTSDPIITTVVGVRPDGPADTLQFVGPIAVTTGIDGSLLVADDLGRRVRRIAEGRAVVVAGTGEAADFGDGGLAVNAAFLSAAASGEGPDGTVYVADRSAHRIRSVTRDGLLHRFAGSANGQSGSSGDGAAATSALLSSPGGVTVDAAGNVYVGDTGNHRVRRVTPAGTITTVAGTGASGFNGDGTATAATLSAPDKVLATAAGVFVADRGNHRVRLIQPAGQIVTAAGGGATTVADGVSALAASLADGFSFTVAPSGTLYVESGGFVYRVDGAGVLRLVSVGSVLGLDPTVEFRGYLDLAVGADGTLYLALAVRTDANFYELPIPARSVVALPPAAQARVFAGTPVIPINPTPDKLQLYSASHLVVSPAGDIWVRHYPPVFGPVARYPHIELASNGATRTVNAASGVPMGRGIASPMVGVVTDFGTSTFNMHRFPVVGNSERLFQGNATGPGCTDGFAFSGEITESSTLGIVWEQDRGGRHCIVRWLGGTTYNPPLGLVGELPSVGTIGGMAAMPDGSIVVSDSAKDQIWKLSATGQVTLVAGTGVYGFSGDGGLATQAQLAHPQGLAVDTDGTIYVADTFSARVRAISPAGIIQTIAGNGTYAYTGDGGPANLASFSKPVAVAVDAAHNVYVLDTAVGTVRRIGAPVPLPAGGARFVPTSPLRILDTRTGVGAAAGLRGPGASIPLAVAGAAGGVPADATAVVVNTTITEAVGPGYVQVLPTGRATIGSSSNLNVDEPGQTIANLVTAKVGDGGTVTLYTSGGGHLVADLLGYYVPVTTPTRDGRYIALTPTRLLDTRSGQGQPAARRPAAQEQVSLLVAGQAGVPAAGASSVVLDLVATETAGPGYVQAFPTGGATAAGQSSNLNVTRAGQTIANLVIVPIGADGTVTLYTHDAAHLVADVLGYVTDGSAPASAVGVFVAIDPGRLVDTRTAGAKPAAGQAVTVSPGGRYGIPADGVSAIFANLTATEASAPGYVQVGPTGRFTYGSSSNLNLERAGQTIPNAAIATLGNGMAADVYTQSGTHLVVDVSGWFVGG